MSVPFIDLALHHKPLKAEILSAVSDIIDSGNYINGVCVSEFEKAWTEACGTQYSIAVANGTEALRLGLLACGIGPGDEVITVANTFVATVEAIALTGARPVLVDVDDAANLDPEKLEAAITPKTRLILPVHLYGQTVDMDAISAIAEKYDLPVFEDAAQAHLSYYKGRAAGSLGDLAAFSFYPTKNLGTIGEGGCITTSNADIAGRVAMLRNHGQAVKYKHAVISGNARMHEIAAKVLTLKMPHLADWNRRRREIALQIRSALSGLPGVSLPVEKDFACSNYHILCLWFEKREQVRAALQAGGISCAMHYPIPCHLQESFAYLGYKKGDFPNSEWQADRLLSLPIYPEMNAAQVNEVIDAVKAAL